MCSFKDTATGKFKLCDMLFKYRVYCMVQLWLCQLKDNVPKILHLRPRFVLKAQFYSFMCTQLHNAFSYGYENWCEGTPIQVHHTFQVSLKSDTLTEYKIQFRFIRMPCIGRNCSFTALHVLSFIVPAAIKSIFGIQVLLYTQCIQTKSYEHWTTRTQVRIQFRFIRIPYFGQNLALTA